jgi:hypothetical protein
MLNSILQMLKKANGETERIKIAQGKNKLPTNFKDGYEKLKNEIKWL